MTLDFDIDRFDEAVAESSAHHHHSMHAAVGGASRRDFLVRTAFATTVITVGSQVLPLSSLFTGIADAQALTDPDIAAFAASLEYTAVATYRAATASGLVTTKAVADAIATFTTEHQAHGDALLAMAGNKIAKDTPNKTLSAALDTQRVQATSETDIVEMAFMVENAMAATHLSSLASLKEVAGQKLTASILPIEAGHAAILGQVLFMGDPKKDKEEAWLPVFQTEAGFIDPTKNPLA